MMSEKMKKIVGTMLLISSGLAKGADGVVVASVTQVLVDDAAYGGCMVRISPSPSTELGTCGADFITLDCDGAFTTSKQSQRKLDSSNLSLVTGNRMAVYFTDTKKHNGYCLATRIDTVAN